jgi:hypothetical protein
LTIVKALSPAASNIDSTPAFVVSRTEVSVADPGNGYQPVNQAELETES